MQSNGETTVSELNKYANDINLDLDVICSKDELCEFLDFAKAELKSKKYFTCILNLDDSNGGGTHWTSFIIFKPNAKTCKCFYFDSFGIIDPKEVSSFCVDLKCKPIVFSTTQIQSLKSSYCGQYCLAFLKAMVSEFPNINEKIYIKFIDTFI